MASLIDKVAYMEKIACQKDIFLTYQRGKYNFYNMCFKNGLVSEKRHKTFPLLLYFGVCTVSPYKIKRNPTSPFFLWLKNVIKVSVHFPNTCESNFQLLSIQFKKQNRASPSPFLVIWPWPSVSSWGVHMSKCLCLSWVSSLMMIADW